MDCDLARAINHPSLASNPEFWERLAELNPKNNVAVKSLILEYSKEALAPSTQTASLKKISAATINISHEAENKAAKLSKINSQHYDQFLATLNENGLQGLKDNPGKWHLEKLPQYGPNARSIRLDIGNRVLFDIEKDGSYTIRRIDNKVGHE